MIGKAELALKIMEGRTNFDEVCVEVYDLYPDMSTRLIRGMALQVMHQRATAGKYRHYSVMPDIDQLNTAYRDWVWYLDKKKTDKIQIKTLKKNKDILRLAGLYDSGVWRLRSKYFEEANKRMKEQ